MGSGWCPSRRSNRTWSSSAEVLRLCWTSGNVMDSPEKLIMSPSIPAMTCALWGVAHQTARSPGFLETLERPRGQEWPRAGQRPSPIVKPCNEYKFAWVELPWTVHVRVPASGCMRSPRNPGQAGKVPWRWSRNVSHAGDGDGTPIPSGNAHVPIYDKM